MHRPPNLQALEARESTISLQTSLSSRICVEKSEQISNIIEPLDHTRVEDMLWVFQSAASVRSRMRRQRRSSIEWKEEHSLRPQAILSVLQYLSRGMYRRI